jgi:hypothetical protein
MFKLTMLFPGVILLVMLSSCSDMINKTGKKNDFFSLMYYSRKMTPAPKPKFWGTPALLETDNTDNATYPSISMNDSGNAMVVWDQGDGVEFNINAKLFHADTGTWDGPVLIEHNDWGDHLNSHAPKVKIAPDGNAIAVWQQHDGSRWHIWGNEYDADTGTWGTEHSLESYTHHGWSHDIGMDGNGNALVVWNQYNDAGTYYDILSNKYNATTVSWGSPVYVEDNTTNSQIPLVHVNEEGYGIATWNGSCVNIYDPVLNQWGSDATLGFSGQVLSMTSDASGDFVILANISQQLYTMKYTISTGSWSSLDQVASLTGFHGNAYVFVDKSDNISIAWRYSTDGLNFDIRFVRYKASSAKWGPVQYVENETATVGSLDATMDSHGNILMVWDQVVGGLPSIQFSRYNSFTHALEIAQPVQTSSESSYSPKIASDSRGNAIAIWQQFDGVRSNIWCNRYE